MPCLFHDLVEGYLQQEGLSATSQAFILESPNLKEYAEHSTEDGAIPACVFVSVFCAITSHIIHFRFPAFLHADGHAQICIFHGSAALFPELVECLPTFKSVSRLTGVCVLFILTVLVWKKSDNDLE